MKTAAIASLRKKLASDATTLGLWVTLESPTITEMAVALGVDWLVVDAEHGHLDWKEIVEHLRAAARSDTVTLVRIAELNGGLIKRALDIGADGVVVPWVETAEQLEEAVAWARYPLEGKRGIGGERATCWGQCMPEHTQLANDHVLVIPIIETVRAARNVSRMCQVSGVEMVFFGPADYSSTAGYRGQWEGPGVAERILEAKDILRAAGKHCGVLATSHENMRERQSQGFRMIGLGMDVGLLMRSLKGALAVLGRDQPVRASFTPESAPASSVAPLPRPPESMRPDRREVMNPAGKGKQFEIARGVTLDCLVGAHNSAKGLTTGIVHFSPGAVLPCHTHAFTESITLLEGTVTFEVEGRCYALKRLDNVVVPAGLAHMARNTSPSSPARLHVALASETPSRTLVDKYFSRRTMPDDSCGFPGGERVNRFASARRFAAGPNTEFVDCFNETVTPGVEMSGGYGLFHPGGRLPAHVHDFDESICIISGQATCVVEGRKYAMSDCATALQPRGRVHYFINESNGPMEMLWVYAGPRPERIVVDERCATIEGDPWKD